MLSGHLARYLLAARGRLAPRQQMPTELVLAALEQALTLRQPAPGLVIHADRGSQYTSLACRARIEKAQAEAGWSTLKTELLPHGGAFASLKEA